MNPLTTALLLAAAASGAPLAEAPYPRRDPDEHELPPDGPPRPGSRPHDEARLAKAEAKRAQKAARRLEVARG